MNEWVSCALWSSRGSFGKHPVGLDVADLRRGDGEKVWVVPRAYDGDDTVTTGENGRELVNCASVCRFVAVTVTAQGDGELNWSMEEFPKI